MTQPNPVPAEDQHQSEYHQTAGRRLRSVRESRGLDIERVAAQLHLARGVIESLERDEYGELPNPVFVAGYLKNYARLLGVDPAPILSAYRQAVPSQDSAVGRPSVRRTSKPRTKGGLPWFWLISLFLIGVSAVLAVFWWQGRGDWYSGETSEAASPQGEEIDAERDLPSRVDTPDDQGGESTAAPVDSFGSTVEVPADAIPLRRPGQASSSPAPGAPEEASTPPADESATIPAASLPVEPQPPATAAAAAEEATAANREVVLQFSGTSWVDVRDAAGEVVLNGEMRDGDRRVLGGEPPYKLVIGNAAATQVSIGGAPFDLATRAQGNVARFSLDPSAPE